METGARKVPHTSDKARPDVESALPASSGASSSMEPSTTPLPPGEGKREKGLEGSGSRPEVSYEHVVVSWFTTFLAFGDDLDYSDFRSLVVITKAGSER